MSEYKEKFDKEFLIRTKKIIQEADKFEYSVTLLLNCTLSLICLPIERSDGPSYRNDRLYDDLASKLNNLDVIIDEMNRNNLNIPSRPKLKCLRNGIAHIKMDSVNKDEKITGVKIVGGTKYKNVKYKCKFNFTAEQLKEFSLFIVDKYLEL